MIDTDAKLVARAQAAIAEAAAEANDEGRALLYSDLHRADQAVGELARRLAEAREHLGVALDSLGVLAERFATVTTEGRKPDVQSRPGTVRPLHRPDPRDTAA